MVSKLRYGIWEGQLMCGKDDSPVSDMLCSRRLWDLQMRIFIWKLYALAEALRKVLSFICEAYKSKHSVCL